MNTDQLNAVRDIWTRYHQDPQGHNRWGKKYVIGATTVQIVLTEPLFEYSEAAAGVMGYGARPVGIRRRVDDAFRAMDEIMQTPESLQAFIETSDRTGPGYCLEVQQRHQRPSKPIMANDPDRGFWSRYNKQTLQELYTRVKDKDRLKQAFQTMTLADFEAEYELVEEAQS